MTVDLLLIFLLMACGALALIIFAAALILLSCANQEARIRRATRIIERKR